MGTEHLERNPRTFPVETLFVFHMVTGAADPSSPAHMAHIDHMREMKVLDLQRGITRWTLGGKGFYGVADQSQCGAGLDGKCGGAMCQIVGIPWSFLAMSPPP